MVVVVVLVLVLMKSPTGTTTTIFGLRGVAFLRVLRVKDIEGLQSRLPSDFLTHVTYRGIKGRPGAQVKRGEEKLRTWETCRKRRVIVTLGTAKFLGRVPKRFSPFLAFKI